MNQRGEPPDLAAMVCSITGHQSQGNIKGQGVFIKPNLVLTCWHVIEGNKTLVFANQNGEQAEIVRGSRFNRKLEDFDLATVMISRPLSSTPVKLARTDDYLYERTGSLATRFNDKLRIYNVGVHEAGINKFMRKEVANLFKGTALEETMTDGLKNIYSEAARYGLPGHQTFEVDMEMRPGYSGSPVFDARGRLASLVCGAPAGAAIRGSKIFFGPPPEKVADFVKSVLAPDNS